MVSDSVVGSQVHWRLVLGKGWVHWNSMLPNPASYVSNSCQKVARPHLKAKAIQKGHQNSHDSCDELYVKNALGNRLVTSAGIG